MARNKQCYSGIGGQAVLEGVMMRNGSKYAVAVRKPDHEIEVMTDEYHGFTQGKLIGKIPFIRGMFVFIDSLVLGLRSLNFSASFYEEDEEKDGEEAAPQEKGTADRKESALTVVTTVISFALAIGLFMLLPYYITTRIKAVLRNESVLAILEGLIRLAIFLIYIISISLMKDIRRLYQYHGAEHKCINCIERGKPLTVAYVQSSSRFHKRCGSSFIVLVMIVSIILFFFIRVDHPLMRVLLRILLIPVIAGISYELIRLAGSSDNLFVRIISAPGIALQRITTKEPDAEMIEVAIASVEAVFDWKAYLKTQFGVELRDEEPENEK